MPLESRHNNCLPWLPWARNANDPVPSVFGDIRSFSCRSTESTSIFFIQTYYVRAFLFPSMKSLTKTPGRRPKRLAGKKKLVPKRMVFFSPTLPSQPASPRHLQSIRFEGGILKGHSWVSKAAGGGKLRKLRIRSFLKLALLGCNLGRFFSHEITSAFVGSFFFGIFGR